jgi:NDP-sugar pyrophosphorylase family protein
VDEGMAITGFFDTSSDCRYISGGVYCLQPSALKTLRRCMEEGRSRMRNFQRALVEDNLSLKAYPFQKILDVDHAADVEKAEEFLANT